MNYIKHSFHPTTTTASNRQDSPDIPPPAPKLASSLNSSVRFNDLISTPQTCNDREKYLTA